MTSHQHHQREQTTMTSQWNTPSNPDLRFASESESGFTTNLNLDSDKSKQSGKQITTPWLSVWSEAQTCIWPSWCHCHSLSLASLKSRLVLPFWYRLTWVVPEKGPLNGCMRACVCVHYWFLTTTDPLQTGSFDLLVTSSSSVIGNCVIFVHDKCLRVTLYTCIHTTLTLRYFRLLVFTQVSLTAA